MKKCALRITIQGRVYSYTQVYLLHSFLHSYSPVCTTVPTPHCVTVPSQDCHVTYQEQCQYRDSRTCRLVTQTVCRYGGRGNKGVYWYRDMASYTIYITDEGTVPPLVGVNVEPPAVDVNTYNGFGYRNGKDLCLFSFYI